MTKSCQTVIQIWLCTCLGEINAYQCRVIYITVSYGISWISKLLKTYSIYKSHEQHHGSLKENFGKLWISLCLLSCKNNLALEWLLISTCVFIANVGVICAEESFHSENTFFSVCVISRIYVATEFIQEFFLYFEYLEVSYKILNYLDSLIFHDIKRYY